MAAAGAACCGEVCVCVCVRVCAQKWQCGAVRASLCEASPENGDTGIWLSGSVCALMFSGAVCCCTALPVCAVSPEGRYSIIVNSLEECWPQGCCGNAHDRGQCKQ